MILSFFSYKGGAGRTQLLANLASYFCFYQAKRVLLIDWDMEAPGLHAYFKDFDTKEIEKGLIEFFFEYKKLMDNKKGKEIDVIDFPTLDESYILRLKTAIPIEEDGQEGCIDFVAAGNYNDINYQTNTTAFNWNEFFDENGKKFILKLRHDLSQKDYDYIFIDSRTGISDYTSICNIYLPNINVFVITPTQQSMDGSKSLIDKILAHPFIKNGRRSNIILPILSRIEQDSSAEPEVWENRFSEDFSPYFLQNELLHSYRDDFRTAFYEIYTRDTVISYDRGVANGEKLFFTDGKKISNNNIDKKYKNIANILNHKEYVYFYVLIQFVDWYLKKDYLEKAIDLLKDLRKLYAQPIYQYEEIEIGLKLITIYKIGNYIQDIIDDEIMKLHKKIKEHQRNTTSEKSSITLSIQAARVYAEDGEYPKATKEIENALLLNTNNKDLERLLSHYQKLYKDKLQAQSIKTLSKSIPTIVKELGIVKGDKVLVDWEDDIYCYPATVLEINDKMNTPYHIKFLADKGEGWYGPKSIYKWDLKIGEKIRCKKEGEDSYLHWAIIQVIYEDELEVKFEDTEEILKINSSNFQITR